MHLIMPLISGIGKYLPNASWKAAANSVAGTAVAAWAFNATEPARIAFQIYSGNLSANPLIVRPEPPKRSLCQFPIDLITSHSQMPGHFCGLVGLKATGKSSSLDLLSQDLPNVIFLGNLETDEVRKALHARLKESVFILPLGLDGGLTRETPETTIINAFSILTKVTGTPPTVLVRVNPAKAAQFDARYFSRQIKTLTASGVMRCIFAASDGAPFQQQATREPRLHLFVASELSTEVSKEYLESKGKPTEDILSLIQFPRTFGSLDTYAASACPENFAAQEFAKQKMKIRASLGGKNGAGARKVYVDLLSNKLVDDYVLSKHGLGPEDAKVIFIQPDILVQALSLSYQFQFQSSRLAAEEVLKEMMEEEARKVG